ncbi:porphobilinogen deaminase [Wenjunlia vitaminophila]|uniref:Porphobilinogen deaminase n=1 Tax=Wenjunlia vitaminophila TaxID=76728 RepID=A0A0T6LXL9_WENVI|nr:hydroxymethylbilane synthase [Wenjunlia vitaminophila]KRV50919.1 porphobilinogen deaminase [Wenjunlia vitaminophila]
MSRTDPRIPRGPNATGPTPLRLGTRRSPLAMAQSRQVAEAVSAATGRRVELVEITTYGDTSRAPMSQIGGTGVFVSALRDALLQRRIDIAVHSLKDLPTGQASGLALAAVPRREDPRDVLVASGGRKLSELPRGARVGTGAPRRAAQLHAWARAHGTVLETVPVRGNVDTRIGLVRSGDLDAVVLARAGLIRLGRLGEVTEVLDTDVILPAPGQGALAVECAADDAALIAALAVLDDPHTRASVTAERSLLAALEAGCSAPVGALADTLGPPPGGTSGTRTGEPPTELRLRAAVGTPDGSVLMQMSTTGPVPASGGDPAALGRELAARMLARGAAGLMGERAH